MAKTFKIKQTDHSAQVAKDVKRRNRLNSIKNELEAGRITSFEQIFAIMSETSISTEMGISFYAFRKKVHDAGEFTLNEVMRLAVLFGVKYDVMADFLRDRIKTKSKSRIFSE
ncbi:MAG: hypothetical protein J0H74_33095 [Chitinophagaceae bacterium]|nr:hypothetical protein [Chitinophagaceae bacterium]